jgi:hypothetical protein
MPTCLFCGCPIISNGDMLTVKYIFSFCSDLLLALLWCIYHGFTCLLLRHDNCDLKSYLLQDLLLDISVPTYFPCVHSEISEEYVIPCLGNVGPSILELRRMPKSDSLIMGHDGAGGFCLW